MIPDTLGDPSSASAAVLKRATEALDHGRDREARDLAQSVLREARDVHPALEARALSFLAHCDRIGSRLRRAREASHHAAHLFEQLGDVSGEAEALTTFAHVALLLGRNDEAVEAALMCVKLCDTLAPAPQTVRAYDCLGLAYSWNGDHGRADASLELAVAIARRCTPPVSIYQPRLNQLWVEAWRLLDQRFETGRLGLLVRMKALRDECRQLEQCGAGTASLPGLQAMARTISLASSALVVVWEAADLDAARLAVAAARSSLKRRPGWLEAFVCWCEAELAWTQSDWVVTEQALIGMREKALLVEHEQLACRAHLLLAQVFERQGKHAEAFREYRALRRRERRVVVDGLGIRESLVTSRLGARRSKVRLQEALDASKQFERWSLEDALTGIANRREFEQRLAERLPAAVEAGKPLTLAMIDVDQFKSVNDRFTHRVGDRVLKTLAAILASQVREHDLPARWAGDEFVILFDDADEALAGQVCERIRAAVEAFDWASVAAGLRLTVSIGLSELEAGDTAESVLHRSDESMYRAKPTNF